MSSSRNNPRNLQKAPEISWQGLSLRKHLKIISDTSKYAFVPSLTNFECQVLEIIPEILKKPRKSAGRGLISENSEYLFLPRFTYCKCHILEIISEILNKPRKYAGRGLILGAALDI